MQKPLLPRMFLWTAGVLLIITGLAKFISAMGHAPILHSLDPVFGIPFAIVFWVVGIIEITVALVCLFSERLAFSSAMLCWLAANFGVYRIGLRWVNYKEPCPCLGHLADALHIPNYVAAIALKGVLVYISTGSIGILFWLWRQNRNPAKLEPVLDVLT